MQSSQTLFIADDHQIVAESVGNSILKEFPNFCIRYFSDGKELFKASLNKKPDIALIDIEMADWNGTKTLSELRSKMPSIKCVMLTMINDLSLAKECKELGAHGFLLKNCSVEELCHALRLIINGEHYFTDKLIKSNRLKSSELENSIHLTDREMELLRYFCDGLSAKEISVITKISHRTVETHKANIMQKFEVNTVGKLVASAIRLGLL